MTDITELYRRFHKPIRKWLERRCHFNGVDPDDVAQEVFVRLLKYPEALSLAERATYIFRVAANVASNYREMAVNRMPHAPVELLILDGLDEHDGFDAVQSIPMDPGDALLDFATPEEITTSESVGRQVRAVVATMPPRAQQCLMLFVEHDLSYEQIAATIGITKRMVARDIFNAYDKLRKVLP